MTVYVDLLFALNTIINYLMLRGSAALGGVQTAVRRLLPAAALGGGYAVVSVLPGLYWVRHWSMQLLCAVLMLLTAFGAKRNTIKQGLFFFALSFAFSGVVLLVIQLAEPDCMFLGGRAYYAVSMPAMLLLAGLCYFVAAMVLRGCGTHTGGDLVSVTLQAEGRSLCVRALRDTGNTLRDPISGQPVMVVEGEKLLQLFPKAQLTQAQLAEPAQAMQKLAEIYPDCRFRLVSYRAVGVQSGLLLAVRCQGIIGKRKQMLLAAFGPAQLGDTFHALWGGKTI